MAPNFAPSLVVSEEILLEPSAADVPTKSINESSMSHWSSLRTGIAPLVLVWSM